MLLDLAIRALVITFAAWLGARWLVAPIRRFGSAAEALGRSLDAPPIDDARGPAEVRQAARVFNAMRDRLREQFAERGRFFAAISHDLRTPLTRIRLRLENFPRDGNVTRCEQDVAEMDAMIDTVLSYLREEGDTEAKQSLDVFSLAEALVDDLVELGRPASISGEPAVITAQPMAMRRCLSNLIDNALRYGGRTDVSVHRDGQAVVVQVDDHGPGIPPEQRAQMLKPFVRLDPSRNRGTGGVGLGLHIAREVAVRNGGTLTLGERPGGGLRVTLRFG